MNKSNRAKKQRAYQKSRNKETKEYRLARDKRRELAKLNPVPSYYEDNPRRCHNNFFTQSNGLLYGVFLLDSFPSGVAEERRLSAPNVIEHDPNEFMK